MSTWEERMSARAKARHQCDCEPECEDTTVLDGAVIRCKGCGLGLGMTTIAILDPDAPYEPPTFHYAITECPYTDGMHRRELAMQARAHGRYG